MWLRNFYNILAWMVVGGSTSTSNFDDSNISVKNASGSFHRYICSASSSSVYYIYSLYPIRYDASTNGLYQTGSTMGTMTGLCFGGGDAEVTYDDYKLAAPLTNSCSTSNKSATTPTYDPNTKTWSSTVQFDLKNTSSTGVVIKEVGLRNDAGVLLYREVLDEPITLGAGITMVYKHTFKFTMPIVNS